MTVRLIKHSWWVDFRFDHIRYRRRSPENSRAGAQAYEATLRHKLARGERIDIEQRKCGADETFEPFAWRWFDEYVVPSNKASEQRGKRYTLRSRLVPFFGNMPISKIGTEHIEQYKAWARKEGLSSKTINNHLAVLGKCLGAAYEWMNLDGRVPKITWLKCPTPKTDYLSEEECALLLSHAHGIIREMILTAMRTGMRQSELGGLQWESIDWRNRSVVVRHQRSDYTKQLESPKNHRERHIPLSEDVYDILHLRRRESGYVFRAEDDRVFSKNRIIRRLTEVYKAAGVRNIGWHGLRHTFASHLTMKGVPLRAVQLLLGHSTITMTMRYAHLAPSTFRFAIDLLTARRSSLSDSWQQVGNQWQDVRQREAA